MQVVLSFSFYFLPFARHCCLAAPSFPAYPNRSLIAQPSNVGLHLGQLEAEKIDKDGGEPSRWANNYSNGLMMITPGRWRPDFLAQISVGASVLEIWKEVEAHLAEAGAGTYCTKGRKQWRNALERAHLQCAAQHNVFLALARSLAYCRLRALGDAIMINGLIQC